MTSLSCGKDKKSCLIDEMDCVKLTSDSILSFYMNYQGEILEDEKLDIELTLKKNNNLDTFDATAERRGGSSIAFDKHSWELDLEDDISLDGLPADDDWILNANYIDKTFLRHVLSYDLFREMTHNNESPKTAYIEVFLNQAYNGLYVLMEKMDKSSLDIDKDDPKAFIFKEPHLFRPTYDGIVPQDPDNFHQQNFPKIDEIDKTQLLDSIHDFIKTSSIEEFSDSIRTLFDVDNIIDWHLLLLMSNNSDGILKNFFLYKVDGGTGIRVAPWDYDHSFGRDGDNELNLDTRPMDITRSILFEKLIQLPWYNNKLKDTWREYNDNNLLSIDGLQDRIKKMSCGIDLLVDKNAIQWPMNSEWYYDDNDFEAEIDIMLDFVEIRHNRVDELFN